MLFLDYSSLSEQSIKGDDGFIPEALILAYLRLAF